MAGRGVLEAAEANAPYARPNSKPDKHKPKRGTTFENSGSSGFSGFVLVHVCFATIACSHA